MFFAASVVVEFSRVMISRLLFTAASVEDDVQRRRSTFIHLLQSIFKYVIYFCVAMMVLSGFGIDLTHILAGAGIVGLTVGLGAQAIVQDLLRGIFLLDRYGRLHIMRNGEIKNVINYSRGWTLAVVEMSVAYEANLKQVLQVIAEVSSRLPEQLPGKAIEVPRVMGIETIYERCLRVRVETKVAPGSHYEVKRALHLLLVEGFQTHHIEIPHPKSVEAAPYAPSP
jgi:moderate conductance mechanosensitive channel